MASTSLMWRSPAGISRPVRLVAFVFICSMVLALVYRLSAFIPLDIGLVILFALLALSTKYLVNEDDSGKVDTSQGLGSSSAAASKNTPSLASGDSTEPAALDDKLLSIRRAPTRILFGTQTGTSKRLAHLLSSDAGSTQASGLATPLESSVVNLAHYDQDNLELECLVIFVLCTWEGGKPPQSAASFCSWLEETALDFRVPRTFLQGVRYAVFGLGDSEYAADGNFCAAASFVDEQMKRLGATRVGEVGLGDASDDLDAEFDIWRQDLWAALRTRETLEQCHNMSTLPASAGGPAAPSFTWDELAGTNSPMHPHSKKESEKLPLKEYRRRKRKAREAAKRKERRDARRAMSDAASFASTAADELEEDRINSFLVGEDDPSLVDMEDLGRVMHEQLAKKRADEVRNGLGSPNEMVTPQQRKALTKEGYKIVGSHSAVKLCRWTKNMLRGRGGCYKHTMYGIISYQCMEATPSLACANKCVFCWRHHKNPVGREWRWRTDPPRMIVDGAIEQHQRMIKSARGIPGVKAERWNEAFTVKHCALSLVGEPIMYPHINELVSMLHEKGISTFLVTNGQFPECIDNLAPITQLYVSVDAATPEALKQVDRPLFSDYWDRFISSLTALKQKQQRTVYRLTLVKSWNMEEAERYADLLSKGEPDFIEIKAVTYCGKSDASDLTMKNVPWHDEVIDYAQAIARFAPGYEIACEHRHSCMVLLAKKQYKIDNVWHTWIDYPKFDELARKFRETGETFSAMDYIAPTPHWAVFGAPEAGFAPYETRFRRTKNGGANTASAESKKLGQ